VKILRALTRHTVPPCRHFRSIQKADIRFQRNICRDVPIVFIQKLPLLATRTDYLCRLRAQYDGGASYAAGALALRIFVTRRNAVSTSALDRVAPAG
jgi:hypothetical protein